MKKFISFLVLCLSFMGAIGGIGYTIYDGAYPHSRRCGCADVPGMASDQEVFH